MVLSLPGNSSTWYSLGSRMWSDTVAAVSYTHLSETVPLEGVKFEVKYANGQYVDAAGGTLSSNGLYYTDSTGKIILSGITGTRCV